MQESYRRQGRSNDGNEPSDKRRYETCDKKWDKGVKQLQEGESHGTTILQSETSPVTDRRERF